MANYQNFSLSRKQSKFYLKQSQPTEGYVEVTYGTNGENKTYHKYFDKIEGVPTTFETKEVSFEGRTLKFMELSLTEGDTINKLSVPLKNRGGYTDEAKALTSALNNLEIGERVSIVARKTTTTGKNGKEYENFNIYINYVDRTDENGKNPSTGYISYEDIPGPIKKEVAGDVTWDWAPQTEFYYERINKIQEKFQNNSGSTTEQPKEEKPKTTSTAAKGKVDEKKSFIPEAKGDLPF